MPSTELPQSADMPGGTEHCPSEDHRAEMASFFGCHAICANNLLQTVPEELNKGNIRWGISSPQ